MQILEMESSLRERRDSFEQDMSSMTLKLEKARQETNQEVLNLRKLKVVLLKNVPLEGDSFIQVDSRVY